ncbi:MAG TPA: sigma-54 dependent transcriptional regulator [Kofleriaceae bacterium]|jgi:two-component system response regulator HydG|nr:sigma-54 dependent transcriptional regulator [Gemmatimonadaceae bacterium]
MTGSILIVEDDADAAMLLRTALAKFGWRVTESQSAEDALRQLATLSADIVLTDVSLPGMSGIELCEKLRTAYPDMLAIVITAGTVDVAIAAIRASAFDFIDKPAKGEVVAIAAQRAMSHLALRRELAALRAKTVVTSDGIAGTSPALKTTMELVRRVAATDATVLITGESGTGKELVAKALHHSSANAAEPFVAVNCAAMPPALLESELFGHVRGAFTDAKSDRDGLFIQAGKGTIFLDEIGEMPIEMQVKLLRVLQERKVRPVGGDQELQVRARVITATNRDLEAQVARKQFREDLYYRINVVAIPLPPLRERRDDILTLAQHFIEQAAERSGKAVRGLHADAARRLMAYDWPGNVRELENCIERAVAVCLLDEITVDDLAPRVLTSATAQAMAALGPGDLITLEEQERRYVRNVLAAVNGNKTHAAKVLGIDRRSVYRRIDEDRETATATFEESRTTPTAPSQTL